MQTNSAIADSVLTELSPKLISGDVVLAVLICETHDFWFSKDALLVCELGDLTEYLGILSRIGQQLLQSFSAVSLDLQ